MPDKRSPEVTSRIMSTVRNKNSKAELRLRRALFAAGARYRVHYSRLEGHPDIVFVSPRLVIFVDGDFWHGNAWKLRGFASYDEQFQFASRPDYWRAKISRNMERDREVNQKLVSEGWRVIRFWESEVLKDVDACAGVVMAALKE